MPTGPSAPNGFLSGVIFVIDTADKIRICLVKDELQMLISNKDLKVCIQHSVPFCSPCGLLDAVCMC